MPKLLTRLRIDEVSAVDRGAGDGVKIVLMKRAMRPDATPADTLKAFPNPNTFRAVLSRMEAEAMAKADDDGDHDASDDSTSASVSDRPVSRLADLLCESGRFTDRGHALRHLTSHPDGVALVRTHKAAKEQPTMSSTSHADFVRDVVKQYGIVALAKSMVKDDKSYGLDEFQFVNLATEHAQRVYPNDRPDAAFSKLYQSEESVRQACNIAKTMPFVADGAPLVVGGADTRDLSDESEAIAQLKQLGARKWPTATEAQQFERALTAPENHALARRAVPLPKPVTSFPFPR